MELLFILCIVSFGLAFDKASFYGASYISYPLQEAKGVTDITFSFRTHLSDALLLLAAGKTDYCMIRLESGRLKLHINLGAGESELSSSKGTNLNDTQWHHVSIIRREANLTMKETYLPVLILLFGKNDAVRLHKLFQFLDGFRSEHDLQGFLHVGEDYAVFLRKPKSHDKFLIYELYESKNVEETNNKPRLLAISKVPVEYIKEQLKKYREELYSAKYVDNNIVPGTEVKTLREWQIDRAVNLKQGVIADKPNILRTIAM